MDCNLPALARGVSAARSIDLATLRDLAVAPARSSPSPDADRPHLFDGLDLAVQPGAAGHRLQIGNLIARLRYLERPTTTHHRGTARRALILVAANGVLAVGTEATNLASPPCVPVLFSCGKPAKVFWPGNSWGLTIDLPRDNVNAAASAALGDARRLASTARLLPRRTPEDNFDFALERLVGLIADASAQGGADLAAFETAFYQGFAARLIAEGQFGPLLLAVRSVGEAMRIIREDHRRDFETEALAARVGVTAQTLRKGFRSCLGLSVKAFIRTVRLDWAKTVLSSGFDARPIEVIARDAGFSSASHFSRAYVKRFGEPPSLTRGRAVRLASG